MRRISIKSPIVLGGLILCAAVAIMTPSWKSTPPKSNPRGLNSLDAASRDFLQPTVGQPAEIQAEIIVQPDMAVAGLQPIGVTKKNTWNPNPSWRTDAGWPTAVRPAELQPITIEKIPSNIVESFPLSAREKSLPPVTGDAIQEKSGLVGNSHQAQLQESANAKIIPWNTFVEEPSSVAARNRTTPAMGAPTSLGRMVSSEQTVQAESFDPNPSSRPTPVATETSSESKSMSPVDAQRFIRQPKTRR